MTPLPGKAIVRQSKQVLADSFIFAFGRRNCAAFLIHAAKDELKMRFDKV
jgi:hypothetical protein